jgi:hypothetical protein
MYEMTPHKKCGVQCMKILNYDNAKLNYNTKY